MRISTDRRGLEVGQAPGSEERFWDGVGRIRDGEAVAGRALARFDAAKRHLLYGCSSAVDWAVRGGVRRRVAARLLRIGRVLEARPGAEEDLRAGRLDAESAAELGKLLHPGGAPTRGVRGAGGDGDATEPSGAGRGAGSDPALLLPDEVMPAGDAAGGGACDPTGAPGDLDLATWIDRAKTLPESQLRREVRAHVEGRAQGQPVVPMAFAVGQSTRDAFRRARTVASRRADTALTDGETLAVVTRDYLDRHDPLLRRRRTRRVGPTAERPGDRYIPAEVRAAVLARSGDRCEFPACGYGMFLQFAHVIGHEDAGDREATNLLRLCSTHHTLLDAGRIRFLRFVATGGRDDEAGAPSVGGTTQRPEFLILATGEVVPAPRFDGSELGPPKRRDSRPDERRARESRPAQAVQAVQASDNATRPRTHQRRAGEVREREPPYGAETRERPATRQLACCVRGRGGVVRATRCRRGFGPP